MYCTVRKCRTDILAEFRFFSCQIKNLTVTVKMKTLQQCNTLLYLNFFTRIPATENPFPRNSHTRNAKKSDVRYIFRTCNGIGVTAEAERQSEN